MNGRNATDTCHRPCLAKMPRLPSGAQPVALTRKAALVPLPDPATFHPAMPVAAPASALARFLNVIERVELGQGQRRLLGRGNHHHLSGGERPKL